jgi:hypothetical protein
LPHAEAELQAPDSHNVLVQLPTTLHVFYNQEQAFERLPWHWKVA